MCYSQNTYEGIIFSQEEKATLSNVNIYDFYEGFITKSDEQGKFSISDTRDSIKLVFHKENFSHKTITINHFKPNNIFLENIRQFKGSKQIHHLKKIKIMKNKSIVKMHY